MAVQCEVLGGQLQGSGVGPRGRPSYLPATPPWPRSQWGRCRAEALKSEAEKGFCSLPPVLGPRWSRGGAGMDLSPPCPPSHLPPLPQPPSGSEQVLRAELKGVGPAPSFLHSHFCASVTSVPRSPRPLGEPHAAFY